ncbi:hypothetical protein BVC80_9101g232 [Macleaya cordata]|uniref:Uncharacterized protein n=1 Tax=Macleaya cordata TaxID=56857 RepID=A0A200QGW3_MACCD|nr:hypothetical protein BVC80_9101g232 [Macleaya cordata]
MENITSKWHIPCFSAIDAERGARVRTKSVEEELLAKDAEWGARSAYAEALNSYTEARIMDAKVLKSYAEALNTDAGMEAMKADEEALNVDKEALNADNESLIVEVQRAVQALIAEVQVLN